MDLRSLIVLLLIIFFGVSYSFALFYAAYGKFVDIMFLNTVRDITFITYVVSISSMALTCSSKLEKELIRVALCYVTIIFIVKILGYNFNMPEVQYQIIFINGITFVLCVMCLISALRHGYFKRN